MLVTTLTRGDNVVSVTTVAEVAREHHVPPHVITNLFYRHALDGEKCPIVSGRRIIPRSYVPQIVRVLRAKGYLPTEEKVSA